MYRIRLVSGQEKTYPSIQELTVGVQSGEVTAEAEIYHQRTERWLSIESHPHYRMAADGGTATRTSRLRFTRPANPGIAPAVLPTPAAKKPGQGDLEELNRLLVLLDPLPTPAQRAEPLPPVVQSPPELTLVRPEPPTVSDQSGQTFGTMLRLEDLEPMPQPESASTDVAPPVLDVIRDTRVVPDEVEEVEEVQEALPPIEAIAEEIVDIAPSDLGLPVEIHLDEIPVAVDMTAAETAEDVAEAIATPTTAAVDVEAMELVEAQPEPAHAAARNPLFDEPSVEVHPSAAQVVAAAPGKRMRPMLLVGAAALIAAAIFAFTSGGSDPEQGMVTLASATAPSAGAVPAQSLDSTPSVPASSTVGFPTAAPAPAPPAAQKQAPAARDSATPANILPSAPTIDLGSSDAEQVSAGAAAPHLDAGSGAALAVGYSRSYDALGVDFAGQMDRSGMVRLFGQTQLTTSDGLAGARRALDAAASAVHKYHLREAAIEKAYQDSAKTLERSGATPADLRDWLTHASRKESQETADEGARLIGQIDAVFALLQAQAGKYKIDGGTIRFDDADASARYADAQSWINRRLEYWSGQPGSSVPVTVRPILEGIGLTRLPTTR